MSAHHLIDQGQSYQSPPPLGQQNSEFEVPLTMVLIRREFNLPEDEDLFDDFKCTLTYSSGAFLGQMS